jgi:acyl dehydratase
MDPAGQAALLTQLQTKVQTLQAAAAAATVPQGGPLVPPVFTLALALANIAIYLDLT